MASWTEAAVAEVTDDILGDAFAPILQVRSCLLYLFTVPNLGLDDSSALDEVRRWMDTILHEDYSERMSGD